MKKQSRIITRNQASSSHKKEAQIGGSSCGFRGVIMIAFKSICASLPHRCRWYLCKCCCCDGTRDEAPATTANRDFLECSLSLSLLQLRGSLLLYINHITSYIMQRKLPEPPLPLSLYLWGAVPFFGFECCVASSMYDGERCCVPNRPAYADGNFLEIL